jgi:hypothetical protein
MTTLNDRATRLTAKVAPYREAITQARKAGLTWGDLVRALGLEVPPAALRQAVKRCHYQAEQIPLPEAAASAQPPARTQVQPSQAMSSPKTLFDSLPRIGGRS